VAVLTGVEGGEGVSFLSLMLALSLGSSPHHKVALLDGNFNPERFRTLSSLLNLSEDSVTIEKGTYKVDGYVNDLHPNVHVLNHSGVRPDSTFFSDRQLGGFLEHLRQHYAFTIVDMPPLLKGTSSLYLAPSADQLYVIASAGKTSVADLEQSKSVAAAAGARISGVVLNRQQTPLWSKLFWRKFFL